MGRLKFCYIGILLLLLGGLLSAGGDEVQPTFRWQVGEVLQYKVRYTFLTVGNLQFSVLGTDSIRGHLVYHCRMHMKSKNIPFVSYDDTYESYIDAEEFYSHRFLSIEKKGDKQLVTRYEMDYPAGIIHLKMEETSEKGSELLVDSIAAVTRPVHDGLSMLYFARANSKSTGKQDIPVFAFNAHRLTYIDFTGKTEEVKARGKKVDGFYLDGRMKFVGIAGLKEEFKGWFSPDAQRIPLQAHMKAIVGSIKLYIETWENWEGEASVGGSDSD